MCRETECAIFTTTFPMIPVCSVDHTEVVDSVPVSDLHNTPDCAPSRLYSVLTPLAFQR